jgi:hypothetical protein
MDGLPKLALTSGREAHCPAGIVRRYGVVKFFIGLVTLSLVPLASIESTV